MATYTADPMVYDTTLIVGDTWTVQVTLTDSAGTAHDLTDVTGEASAAREVGSAAVATPTVTVTDAAAGQFEVVLAAAATADLTPGRYVYAVRLTWPDDTVRTVIEGVLSVRRTAVG